MDRKHICDRPNYFSLHATISQKNTSPKMKHQLHNFTQWPKRKKNYYCLIYNRKQLKETPISNHLFSILKQDIVKLLHHLRINSLARPYVSELQQHVKSALSWPQCLEGFIDEMFGFIFYGFDLLVEPIHHFLPLQLVFETEWIKGYLKEKNVYFFLASAISWRLSAVNTCTKKLKKHVYIQTNGPISMNFRYRYMYKINDLSN